MFKKLYRGLYLLMFVMFLAGSFCLFPTLKGVNARAAEEGVTQTLEQDVPPETLPTAKWSEVWKNELGSTTMSDAGTLPTAGGISQIQSGEVYLISDATELAKAAYLINSDASYRSATFVLDPTRTEFDMSSALWTPIGRVDAPFTGIFYGNGVKIKNIVIENISCDKSHAGFFGTIDGATITDVVLSGYQTISVSGTLTGGTTRLKGALVAEVKGNSYIINCHDEFSSKTSMIDTTSSTDYASIGTITSSAYIFKSPYSGISSNGQATLNSKVKKIMEDGGRTTPNINDFANIVTVESGSYNQGYVAFYYAKAGRFCINNPLNPTNPTDKSENNGVMVEWPDMDGKIARVLLSTTSIPTGTLTNFKAQLYRTNYIKLRAEAGENDLFVLNQGNKANNLTNNSTTTVNEIGYDAASTSITLDYGYGERTSISLDLDYDQTFRSFFEAHPGYRQRVGYTFANLKRNAEEIFVEGKKINYTSMFIDAVSKYILDSNDKEVIGKDNEPLYYKKSFPDVDASYTFEWTSTRSRAFNINFAYASDEGGLISDDFRDGNQNSYLKEVSATTEIAKPAKTGETYNITNITEDSYTFEITLQPGYVIRETKNEFGGEAGDECSVNDVKKAAKLSGAYPYFIKITNKDDSYAINEQNNDSYNMVKTSVTWTNTSEYNNATIKTGQNGCSKKYTVTVENLVSDTAAGTVYVVIERDFVSIDLTPVNVDAAGSTGSVSKLAYHFESNDLKAELEYVNNPEVYKLAYLTYKVVENDEEKIKIYNAVKGSPDSCKELTEDNNPILYIRYKESITDINFIEKDKYLLNKDSRNSVGAGFNCDENGINAYYDSPIESTKSEFSDYYQGWSLKFSAMNHSYNYLTIYVGTLKTKANVEFYRSTEDGLVRMENKDELKGLAIYFQSDPIAYQNTTCFIQMTGQDQIYVSRNGNYQIKTVNIYDLSGHDSTVQISLVNEGESGLTFGKGEQTSLIAANYYLAYYGSASRMFKNAYSNKSNNDEENTNYRVEVIFEERVHDIKVEYYVGAQGSTNEKFQKIDENNYDRLFESNPSITQLAQRPSALSGKTYRFGYVLNNVGHGILKYLKYEIHQDYVDGNPENGTKLAVTSSDPNGKPNQQIDFIVRDGFTLTTLENFNMSGANGGFDVNLGGYATVIKVYFDFKTDHEILVNKLFVLGEGGGLIENNSSLLSEITFSGLSYSFEGNVLRLTSSGLGSVSIHSQYYLLGWYLVNGEVKVENDYGGILTNEDFVTAVATHYSSSTSPFDGIAVLVAPRTVNVSYYTDDTAKGYGEIYDKNKLLLEAVDGKYIETAFTVLYGQEKVVNNNIFYNLGYAFNKYIPTFGTMINDNSSYKIESKMWVDLFENRNNNNNLIDDATLKQSWNYVVLTNEMQTEADLKLMSASVELKAQWDIIKYYANIDDANGVMVDSQNILTIGSRITYSTDKSKRNGQAFYTFTGNDGSPKSIAGVENNGYIVTGIKVTHADGKDGKTFTDEEWDNGNGYFDLTPEVLKSFLKEEYYFNVNTNDDKISFTTLRTEAEFYLELVNSKDNYYQYTWNEKAGSEDYGFKDGNTIKIRVKFNHPATNILEAESKGYLVVTRLGYSHKGWALATSNGDQSTQTFDPNAVYSDPIDKSVVPTWALMMNKATTSKLAFNEDVGSVRQFYLLTAHEIMTGTVGCSAPDKDHTGANPEVRINRILDNGDKIVGYQFEVTYNGTTEYFTNENNTTSFDIQKLFKAGSYSIQFRLKIEDSLSKVETLKYEQLSGVLSFDMIKNELAFYGHDLKAVYTGTNEFVEATVANNYGSNDRNNFGNVKLRYEWNGGENTGIIMGQTTDYFVTNDTKDGGIEVVGSGAALDAGSGKSLKIKFNLSAFASMFGEGRIYGDLLTNATYDASLKSDNTISFVGGEYYVTFTNALEIEKAVFKIEFPSGAAYYFKGMEVVAFTNIGDGGQITYNIQKGRSVFNYTFSQITLVPTNGDTKPGPYQGQENHIADEKIFAVHNLEISKSADNAMEELKNFEWIISTGSLFQVIDSNDALGLNYTTKYLTAQNGELNALSETYTYKGKTEQDLLYLSTLLIDGTSYELKSQVTGNVKIDIKGNQGSIYINNIVALSFVGNNTTSLQIIVNKSTIASSEIKFDVNIKKSEQINDRLKLLEFAQDTLVDSALITNDDYKANISKLFDDGVDSGYKTSVTLPSETYLTKHNIFAVLTDVVKIEIDFNNKANAEESDKTTVYSSISSGEFNVLNPTHEDGQYLRFNGYFNALGNLSNVNISEVLGPGESVFSNIQAGSTERIKAKWLFTNFTFDITAQDSTIDKNGDGTLLYASTREILYPTANFMTIGAPKVAELSITMTSKNKFVPDSTNHITLNYVPGENDNSGSIRIVDWLSQASVRLNDTYIISVTYTFNDNASDKVQTLTLTKEVILKITRNTIGFTYNETTLVYRNEDQEGRVTISTTLNGETGASTKLNILSASVDVDNPFHFHAVVKDSKNANAKLNRADTYTVVNTIDRSMVDVYQFGLDGGNNPIYEQNQTITINQYEISLADYVAGFEPNNITKYFGQEDQDPIFEILKINKDLGKEASVQVNFERDKDETSEAIGQHRLKNPTLTNDEDKNNYIIIDKDTFEAYYTIKTPVASIQVELSRNLTYIYNGRAISEYNITFDASAEDYKYSLTIVAGADSDTIKFNIYYNFGNQRIDVPTTEVEKYARYLSFTSNSEAAANLDGYTLSVSLTELAENAGWTGIEFDEKSVENAKIVVNKRELNVTSITKVYDGTTKFLFNTVSTSGNTCNMTFGRDDVVRYDDGSIDEIQLSGEFVGANNGRQDLKKDTLKIDEQGSVYSNYTLVYEKSGSNILKVDLVADDSSVVDYVTNCTELVYKSITKSNIEDPAELARVLDQFRFTYQYNSTGATIDSTRFTIVDVEIEKQNIYSTGNFLKVGEYILKFTIQSKDFTFGQTRGDLGITYSTTFEKGLTITKKELTIQNSQPINKKYDGNPDLLGIFIGQNVNAAGGYYSSKEPLDGDIITVVSGQFGSGRDESFVADGAYGNNKNVNLVFDRASDDSDNYKIILTTTGNITAVELYFNKIGNTQKFVNDGITEFTKNNQISVQYAGEIDTFIRALLGVERIERVGYRCIGYRFESAGGIEISTDTSIMSEEKKAEFLQAAVDAGEGGLDIYAIWERKTYDVTVVISHGTLTDENSGNVSTLIAKIPYYNTIEDGSNYINYTITAEEGYKFTGINSAELKDLIDAKVKSGLNNKNASITLEKIKGDCTLKITIEEIKVKIVINPNQLSGFTVSTDSEKWPSWDRVMSYSELIAEDLPVIKYDRGYLFNHWELNEIPCSHEKISLWERIGGVDLEEDVTDSRFTFAAIWQEDEILISINHPHSNIVVYDLSSDSPNTPLVKRTEDGKYKTYFSHDIKVVITSDDFYKWTDVSISDGINKGLEDLTERNKKIGEFKITYIQTNHDITVTCSPIVFTFKTDYTIPTETEISEKRGSITGEFSIEKGGVDYSNATLADMFGATYTPTRGTYTQTGWSMHGSTIKNFSLDIKVIDVIIAHLSTRLEDTTISLDAFFEGVEYQVKFVNKNTTDYKFGNEGEVEYVVKSIRYGSILSENDIPKLVRKDSAPNEEYVWLIMTGEGNDRKIETFDVGEQFVSKYFKSNDPNGDYTMTLEATWGFAYKITIKVSGTPESMDKLISVDGKPYTGSIELRYFNGVEKYFMFNIDRGYEILSVAGFHDGDKYSFRGDDLDNSGRKNYLLVSGFETAEGETENTRTITVTLGPKSYNATVQISEKNYYKFASESVSENFVINYDEDVSAFFNARVMIRDGFNFKGFTLNDTGIIVASYDGSNYTFSNPLVYNDSNKFCYDDSRELTLKPVWERKSESEYTYFSISTSQKTGLVYDSSEQTVASSTISINGRRAYLDLKNAPSSLNPFILSNGEKIVELYYIVNDKPNVLYNFKSTTIGSDTLMELELIYKDVISGKVKLYAKLVDSLNPADTGREITGDLTDIAIAPASIAIDGANLESYYSGTSTYIPTGNGTNNGRVIFAGKTPITVNSELEIEKVEIVDPTGKFFAEDGKNYSVRYYFKKNGFTLSNYASGQFTDETPTSIVYETSAVTAQIKQTPITLTFVEQGFFKGSAHKVSNVGFEILAAVTDVVKDKFIVNIESVFTNSDAIGEYKNVGQFVITSTIYTQSSTENLLDNFVYTLSENTKFSIIPLDDAYTLNLGARYFDTTNFSDSNDVNNIVRVNSFVSGTTTVTVENGDMNYISPEGTLVLSLVKNGNKDIRVIIAKGQVVDFNLEINVLSPMAVLKWSSINYTADDKNLFIEGLKDSLNKLTPADITTTTVFTTQASTESDVTYVAVITDYKAVKLSLGDVLGPNGEEDLDYSYVKLGGEITLSDPEVALGDVKGFEFSSWSKGDIDSLTINGFKLSADKNAGIYSCEITAIWTLEAPDITAKNYQFDADVNYGAEKEVTIDDILTERVANYNNQIVYRYSLSKGGEEIILNAENDSFTFNLPRNSTSTGDYFLTVTATFKNLTEIGKEVKSVITVNLLKLTSVTFETQNIEYEFDNLVYSNRDFVGDILVTITGGGLGQYNLSDLLNNNELSYRFNINYRKDLSSAVANATQIKDFGYYTINLDADPTIFDVSEIALGELNTSVNVAKKEIVIGINDIPELQRSKLFGSDDPERFIFVKPMFDGEYAQNAYIELFREQGENQGIYKFVRPVALDRTYTVPDDNFTISLDESAVYTISKADIIVTMTFEKSIAKIYDKVAPKFTLKYDLDGEWYLYIDNVNDNNYVKLLLTYQYTNGTEANVGNTFRPLVLENIGLTTTVFEVGNYDQDDIILDSERGNFAGYNLVGEFVINQRMLQFDSENPIYKEFDRTNLIGKTDAHFTNVVEGDEVYMTGKYEGAVVGTYDLREIALAGQQAKNYVIQDPNTVSYVGVIIPRNDTGDISLTISKDKFIYGDINSIVDISVTLGKVGELLLSIGGFTDDIENGFVTISEIRFENGQSSVGGNLIAGENRKIIFVIKSDNFELFKDGYEYGRGGSANPVLVTIDRFPLDLQIVSPVMKPYDGTNKLPAEIRDKDISSFARPGDEVYIDHTKGGFDSAEIGENKKVTLVLGGRDASNYIVKDDGIVGIIAPYIIDISVEVETRHVTLVNGGDFVNDGLSPTSVAPFKVSYPFAENFTGLDLINTFDRPTRKGYAFKGWYIADGNGGYNILDENNIETVLRSIALNPDVVNELTIYAGWEIEVYSIMLNYNNVENITVSANPQSALIENEGMYFVQYFTDVEIHYTAERGYKILAHTKNSGEATDFNLSDTSRIVSKVTITGVASNISLTTTLEQIKVTFAIDANIPEFTSRTDLNNLQPKLDYSVLGDLTEKDLPVLSVTEGTYNFVRYTYRDNVSGIYKNLDGKTLKEIVDSVYPTLEGDSVILLLANWDGEVYTVVFDSNGGAITGSNKREVKYGSEISSFPVAVNPGKYPVWHDEKGKVYEERQRLSTIGVKGNDGYSLTLTADWENDTFNLLVTFDEGVSVTFGGNKLTSGEILNITYEDPAIRLKVEVIKGYEFAYSVDNIYGTFTSLGNGEFTVQNLIADSSLDFKRVPANNILSLRNTNIDSFEVKVDGVVVNPNLVQGAYQINAKTEQEVIIVYKAKKGYEFEEGNTYDFLTDGTGSEGGDIVATISEDKKTLTIVWNNFVTSASINARAVPSTNIVEFGDVREIFAQLSFNSNNMNLAGGSFPIKTGSSLVIEGIMAFGYKGGNLTTGDKNYVVEGSVQNIYENGEKYYRFSAIVAGFDEGFTITFVGSPRSFNFSIGVKEGEEAYGEITCDTNQTVNFRDNIILSQQEKVDNFEFVCWQIGDKIISTEATTTVEVNDDIEDELIAAGEDGTVAIKAHYTRKAREITLTSTGKGGFIASQASENISVEVNGFVTQKFYLGVDLVIDLVPNNGYELSYILIDGRRVSDEDNAKYGYDGKRFTIPLDLENPIQTLEVVFRPCEIFVNVQAGTIINFIPNLGSAAGGHVYLTDAQGERLGEDKYLSLGGELIVGANYKYLSHTDETIYLEIKPKTGFTPSIIINTAGTSINEFKKADGTVIKVITGAVDGTSITVLFTAQENLVNIIFSNDGEEVKSVHGGIIVVDTDSALVSSSPTRGDNVRVAVVTGEELNVEINSLTSYYLVTNPDGTLKYDIIYSSDEDEKFKDVNVGEVKPQKPLEVGFNESSTLTIGEVNVSATIVIYVKPIEYTINFVVDDGVAPVVMTDKVRYGDEWNISSLTPEQKALVFAEKKNYTFTGYYTGTNAYGTQYIDRYGEITKTWQNTGYFYNGTAWEKEANYDPTTQTFTLYAGWTFNNSKVKLEVLPEIAVDPSYSIHSYVANINDVGAFVGQDDVWLATAAVGETFNFVAPQVPGYSFAYFAVKFGDGDYSNRGKSFDLLLEMGEYFVRAVYNPNFTIAIQNENNDKADGGSSYMKQDNTLVEGSFDFSKLVSIFAKPADGYAFLYWIDNDTGAKIYGEENGEGEYVYTYENNIYKSLNLTAVFKGKEVEVNFNSYELGNAHIIRGVLVNGEIVDYTKPFKVFVGDTIIVRVSKVRGYGFGDSLFTSSYDEESGYYVFSYLFKVEDLDVVEEGVKYKVDLTIPVTMEDITIKFNLNMLDPIDSLEISKTGSFDWVNADGVWSSIENGGSRVVKYGETYMLVIKQHTNYKYSDAYLANKGLSFNISGFVVDGSLTINKDFLDRFFDYEININIFFTRMLWTDEDAYAKTFTGSGTDEDPYIITNAEEFALLAKLVNNGEQNEEGRLYSECSYVVTADINFEGRYWVPVGTEENPFKGKIDLGSYHYDNVVHYTSYPGAKYGGLFWYIGENAQINQNQKTFTTMIVIICVSILLLIILIILFILWARRRKKKLEELSNQ